MRLITDFRVHNLAMMMKYIISLFGWGCDELQTTLSKAYLASHIPLWILPHLEFRNGPSLHLIARIYPFLVHNHFPSEELGESDNRLTLSFLSIIIILVFRGSFMYLNRHLLLEDLNLKKLCSWLATKILQHPQLDSGKQRIPRKSSRSKAEK